MPDQERPNAASEARLKAFEYLSGGRAVNERKRFFLLILIMTGVSLVVGGIAIVFLYRAALDETRQRLVETAQSQARLIESVARFDSQWSTDFPEGPVAATLEQITDAHERYREFGQTGEFTLARRAEVDGVDSIVFLLSHRHGDLGSPKPVPFESELAEPMRRALLGQSDTVTGLDYRGVKVIAAHEPVAEVDLGIVAKIDIAEVRGPFIKASLFGLGPALLAILLGSALFLRVSNPILQRLREANEQLEQRVQERTAELVGANERLRREVEDRIRTEQSLQTSEATFRAVFNSAPVMMLLLDDSRRVRLMNSAAEDSLIRWERDVLGQPFGDAVSCINASSPGGCGHSPNCGDCPVGRVVVKTFETGQDQPAQEVKLTLGEAGDQHDGHFLVSTALPELPNRREVLVCVEDITQRKRNEEQIRTNLEVQKATSEILRISLEPLSVDEFLVQVLDFLVSIRWIAIQSKGAILLAEEDSDTLVMKAQHGLRQEQLVSCARVPSGKCLCGRAASTREIVFADGIDERHEVQYPDMVPHGHYCVPITSDERLYGVLNLYVAEGHERKPEEELFLSSIASILATTIERKQAEEALHKSEERFDLAVRGTDAGIWDWDLEKNSVYFSPRWKSMLGHEDDEISDDFSEWQDRVHPEDRAHAQQTINDYLEGKSAVYELEHRLQHKDGSYRWILARGAVVRDQQGKPYRMVGSHIDITQRKDAEEALSKREGQLRLAQSIQEHLLPDKPPAVPGFDIAGALYPAEFAAGDHYDYLDMSDGPLGLVIGDVSGKGIGPAILMASLRARLRSFAMTDFEIDEILARTNFALANEVEESLFITGILARLDTTTRTLTYVNAGHPPGYVLDRAGDVRTLMESTGIPLGILPDAEFPIGPSIKLEQGDTMILFTDGAFEAWSSEGKYFGMERLLEQLTHK